MERAWRQEGIDLTCCPRIPGTNGIYFISVTRDGEREFTYRRAFSAASTLAPEDLDRAYIAKADTLILSGITQALSDSAEAATLEAARIARKAGVRIAYDLNYRSALWHDRANHSGMAEKGPLLAQEAMHRLLPFIDVLLISFPADALFFAPKAETPKQLLDRLPETAATVVRCGEHGVLLRSEEIYEVPALFAEVRDTTGAGDAWSGIFLSNLSRGEPPLDAARRAMWAAASVIAFRGAIPPRDAFIASLEKGRDNATSE